MLSVEEIIRFVKNIHIAKDRKLQEDSLPLWVREINNTKTDSVALNKAELEIIRNNVPLKIYDVCEVIKSCSKLPELPPLTKCEYCGGKRYMYSNLYFNKEGVFLSDNYAIACICNPKPNTTQMQLNDDNNKTETVNGYFRCFGNPLEQHKYLQKVLKNKGRDIK